MSRHQKQALRKELLSKRKNLTDRQVMTAAESVLNHMIRMPEYMAAPNVFIYVDMNNELPTKRLIERAVEDGKHVYLPKVIDAESMSFYRFIGFDQLMDGPFGLKEPSPVNKGEPGSNDLMCLPGIAFSKDGFRLGYGAGYYDNYLKGKSVIKAGLAYDENLLNTLPHEAHDQPVDMVVTPSAVHRIDTK